jgi:threonine synthase
MTTLTHLECSLCGAKYDPGKAQTACVCSGPLVARYDLEAARAGWSRDWVKNGPWNMWRYAPVLPVRKPSSIVSLGEGLTPLIRAGRLGARLGATNLWIKDEGRNPAGTFEARGFSCAVSMAVELGVRELAIPAPSSAGSALAAYAAAAGIQAHIFMPRGTPRSEYVECRAYGARVTLVDSLDVRPFQEPYRIEGEKTLGYEIAEQMGWTLPDAILCPAGAGLAGMGKAFEEMEQLGWITAQRPKMIAASTAVEAGGRELVDAGLELAALEGVFAAPEGTAALVALRKLLADGFLKPEERIVLCNTASGLKHLEAYATRFPRAAESEQDKLGGLITPR